MTLIITGSQSFIGKELQRQAGRLGFRCFGVDAASGAADHLRADITIPGWAGRIPEADAIVHLAAVSRDEDCRLRPALATRTNLEGTLAVAEAARERGIPQVIFASSEWVYGSRPDAAPLREQDPIDINAIDGEYALTKLAGERLLTIAARRHGLAATILRFGIVYGPRRENWSAVEALHHAVRTRDEIEVGCLDTARRFVHVADIGRAIVAAVGRQGCETFNISGDRLVRLGDIIRESCALTGRQPVVRERSPGNPSIRNADNSHARAELGWAPQVNLSAGLRSLDEAAA